MHCGRVAARVPRPQRYAQQQQPRPCRRRLVATVVCVVLCALLVACLAQAAAQEQPPQQREQTATAHAPDTAPPRCHLGVHLAWSARVGGSVVATPRVVDLLHDGTRQLLVPTFSHYLEALRGDSGADVRGFPFLHPRLRTYASPLPLRVYDDARAAWLVALHSGVLVAFDADGRVRGVLRVPQLLVKKDWRTQTTTTTTHDAALDQLAMLRATTATPAAATAAATATATLSAQQQQQQHDATRQTTTTRADAAEQLDAVLRARRGDDGVDRAVLASRRKHGNHGDDDNNNNDDMLHGQAQRRDARAATPATRDTTTAAADDDDKDDAARAAQPPTREDMQATTTATAVSANGNDDEDDEDDDEAMRAVKVMRDHDDYMHRDDDDDDDAPWGEALSVDRDGAVQRVGTEAHLSLEARASMALLFHPERYYSDTAATTATRKAARRGADDADDEDAATEHDVFDAHTRRQRRGAGTRAATVADDVVALDAHVYTTPVLVDTGRDDAMDVVLHVSYFVDDDDDDDANDTTTTSDVARQTTATAVVVMDVVTGAVKWSRVLQLSSRGTSGGGGVDAYKDEHRDNRSGNNDDSRTTTHTPESSDGATNEETTTTTTTTAPSSSSASSSPVVALSSPLVVDADGDGVAEVYVTTASGAVVGLSESGRLLPPWPRQPGGALAAAVAAEDITGSGQLHLCVGDMDGRVVCYTAAGDELWHRDVVGGVTTHVTFGDVDGDGVMDVVFGTTAGFVYALRGTDGAVLRHFPQRTHGPVLAPVLLVDLHARASSPSVQQPPPPSSSSLPHTPLQRSRGLHLVVPAHDGRVYILDGVSGCVDTIDVDERASTMVLADDVTGSGMTELVVTTLGGGVYVFATHTPFHPLKRWDSATKSLNGHTASESAVGVYMAHVPPRGLRHVRGDTMLLHVVVHDARTSAATAAAAPQAPPPPQRWQGYHVVVRAGAHAVLWRGVLTRPGLHTLRLRVPPQRLYATLTVTMTLPSGQTYSDHVACRFHAHVLDTVKYSLLVPFLCVCAALMLVHRRHIRYTHDGDEDAIDAYRRA